MGLERRSDGARHVLEPLAELLIGANLFPPDNNLLTGAVLSHSTDEGTEA